MRALLSNNSLRILSKWFHPTIVLNLRNLIRNPLKNAITNQDVIFTFATNKTTHFCSDLASTLSNITFSSNSVTYQFSILFGTY